MASIRTMVVDDEKPARVRLLELLQRQPDVDVVGTASDGHEALRCFAASRLNSCSLMSRCRSWMALASCDS